MATPDPKTGIYEELLPICTDLGHLWMSQNATDAKGSVSKVAERCARCGSYRHKDQWMGPYGIGKRPNHMGVDK